ncbi:Abnormal spindle-like microcephaly-associated protein [Trichinella papuae]|uniref:Abnormal spindle-like microcephaly-associated protein n=1 Tax=Trichinella papuae TaxID=268474 RepID=A0A0V1MRX3_9BILA|nr:Abnormal spindle-like microcephaly-associated protein [Trichinella papuae]
MASFALYSPSQSPVRLELTHFSRTSILSFGSITFGKTAQQSFLVVNNKHCDQQFFFDLSSVNRTDISIDNDAALVPAKGEIECVVKWKPTETGNFRLSLPLKVTMFPSDDDEYLDVPIRYCLRATLVGSCVLPQQISIKQKKVPLCMQEIPMKCVQSNKSNVKMARQFESEKLSARPNKIQANSNSQQLVRKDANFKLPFAEHVFTTFLNHLLTQDFITDDSNSEATQVNFTKIFSSSSASVSPKAAVKRRVSLKQYAAVQQLNLLRLSASKAFCEVRAVVYRVCQAVEKGKILVRRDVAVHRDQGIMRFIIKLLLSVHPLWLRIGLEVVYSEIIELDGDCTVRGLISFIRFRMLSDPELLKQYGIAHVRNIYKNDYQPAISKFFLQKFLSLFIFLDFAKQKRLIKQDPCLFNPNSKYKTIRDVLIALNKEILSGEGNLFKTLAAVGYVPKYEQAWYDEKPLAIENLAVDLRDGLALTRLAAMFTENPGLVTNLRGPPISRLQKLHNVQLALDNFRLANINIGDVDVASIVGGNCDKTMALLWRLILHKVGLEFPDEVVQSPLMPEIISLRRSLRMKNSPEAKKMLNIKLHKKMTISELFICWLGCIAAHYGIEVDNLNLSLADGRVLCCTINYYLPSVLPVDVIKFETSMTTSRESFIPPNELKFNEKSNHMLFQKSIREIGHVPDFFEFDRLQNLEYTDERIWILCLNSLATVLFTLRREQQAACVIQKAWKTFLHKNRQQVVEKDEYATVESDGHFNEHLLIQNDEQLKIEENEKCIIDEMPFDEKEKGETCAVGIVDENDKMECGDNLPMEIETLIEFQACCRRKLVLNNFLQQYKSDSGNESERSDEEQCVKELLNAQSDQNADALECLIKEEVVQQQDYVYCSDVKSNSSLLDADECKVENSYAVRDVKDESSLFENNIINLNRNQSVIANESVCLLETNVAAHKQNELMKPTLGDQKSKKPEFQSTSSFLLNLSDIQDALPTVDEVKSISLADIPRIIIEECCSPAETTASILSSSMSAPQYSGSSGSGFAELDAGNEADCAALPSLLIEKLPKFDDLLEMFQFRPFEEKHYSPLNFHERQKPLYKSTTVLSLSNENFEDLIHFSDESGQSSAALLSNDGASSAKCDVSSENLLNMQMSWNCNYEQTDQTEADLKPSNDEVIAFNEPGNVAAVTDCTDLSMGPTESLFCSDLCNQNFIALKTDKSVSLMEAVDNLKHLTEIPHEEAFLANQTSMNNIAVDCLSPARFDNLMDTAKFDSASVGENAAEVNVEFHNLTSTKSSHDQTISASLFAAFVESDFERTHESTVNFNQSSPIYRRIEIPNLNEKCTPTGIVNEDADTTVQVATFMESDLERTHESTANFKQSFPIYRRIEIPNLHEKCTPTGIVNEDADTTVQVATFMESDLERTHESTANFKQSFPIYRRIEIPNLHEKCTPTGIVNEDADTTVQVATFMESDLERTHESTVNFNKSFPIYRRIEIPNLHEKCTPTGIVNEDADTTVQVATFMESDLERTHESTVNFNQSSPIYRRIEIPNLYEKCTPTGIVTEDADTVVQVEPTARSSECGSSPDNSEKKLNITETSNLSDKENIDDFSEDFVSKEIEDYFETPSLRSMRSAIEVDSKFQMTPYVAECERLANKNDSLSFNFLKLSSTDFETPKQNCLHNSSSSYSDILNASARNIFEEIMSAEAKKKKKPDGISRRIPCLTLQQHVMDSIIEQENYLDTEMPKIVTEHDEISNLLKTIVKSDRLVCIENAVKRLTELSGKSEDMCKRMVQLDCTKKLLALLNRLNRSFSSSIIIGMVMKCLKHITSHQSTMKSVTESVDWFQSLARQLIYFKDTKPSDIFCNIATIFCQLSVLDVAQAAFQENPQFVNRFEHIRKHISKRHKWLVKKCESTSSSLTENLQLRDSALQLEALKALYSRYELSKTHQ